MVATRRKAKRKTPGRAPTEETPARRRALLVEAAQEIYATESGSERLLAARMSILISCKMRLGPLEFKAADWFLSGRGLLFDSVRRFGLRGGVIETILDAIAEATREVLAESRMPGGGRRL